MTCFLGNTPSLNLGGNEVVPKDPLHDGKIHLVCLRKKHLEGLGQFANTLKEAFTEIENLDLTSTSAVKIETDEPQPVILDGESVGSTPLEVSVHSKRLKVAVPAG